MENSYNSRMLLRRYGILLCFWVPYSQVSMKAFQSTFKVPSAGGATCTRKWTMANLQYRLVSCLDNFDPAIHCIWSDIFGLACLKVNRDIIQWNAEMLAIEHNQAASFVTLEAVLSTSAPLSCQLPSSWPIAMKSGRKNTRTGLLFQCQHMPTSGLCCLSHPRSCCDKRPRTGACERMLMRTPRWNGAQIQLVANMLANIKGWSFGGHRFLLHFACVFGHSMPFYTILYPE